MKFKSQKIYRFTFFIWLTAVVFHAISHLIKVFKFLPSDEVYANSIGFQFVAYFLTILPFWILVLILILLIEYFIFRKK